MEQIWNITLSIIASVGGAGGIIWMIVKFASNIIAEKLSKKYEIEMNKTLESYKVNLEKKMYISKTRFDTEFKIYRELTETVLAMVEATYWLFPGGLDTSPPQNEEERKKFYIDRYKNANQAINTAQKAIQANAAFISDVFYNKFNEIKKLCIIQYNMYNWCGALGLKTDEFCKAKSDEETACWRRTKEIKEKQDELIVDLREYLNKLDVWEDK